jgi:hypothetical protein
MSVTPLNLIDEFEFEQIEELTSKFSELNIKDKKRKWSDTDMAHDEEHNVSLPIITYIDRYNIIENDEDLEDGEIAEHEDLEDGEIAEHEDLEDGEIAEHEDLEEDTRMDVVEDEDEDEDEDYYIVEIEDSGPLKLSDLYV